MTRIAPVLLCLALAGCDKPLAPKSIETPRGAVTYKERVRADGKFEATLRDLSSAEAARLKESAAKAAGFIAKYVPPAQRRKDLLENLDAAFTAWLNSPSPSKEAAAEVEWIVGAALGDYCIERLPVRWSVATDHGGTEFMIVGDNPRVWSYPLAAVRYRIEDRKTDFVGAVYEALVYFRQKAS